MDELEKGPHVYVESNVTITNALEAKDHLYLLGYELRL